MRITATVRQESTRRDVAVETDGRRTDLALPAVNGGELLASALATCFVNDLFREAPAHDVTVDAVRVTVEAQFGGRGEPARALSYSVHVESGDDPVRVAALVRATDAVAEVHNTLRPALPVTLTDVRIGSA
ncbi:hypothetical protein AFL01nite_25270 [Aeromicrobium flavum]|uniref:Osmotically inducible protein C n=1 Tax=Aeromicrobium flavum TaxID=416568 RepID=A0A512HXT8_9ACTN|nr:OsmC family protein [Aeromicrobium flavum]GEO90200.1 hypothetical protein AFL01nite_25270 [Aeromicrobium flavum]